jgi:glycosyltransferase involved in cell wall biosynthesis
VQNNRIAFLVIDYMPHQLTTINTLIEKYNCEVMSFTFKASIPTPQIEKHQSYQFVQYNKLGTLEKLTIFNPDLLVVAGWYIKDYVWISKEVRRRLNVPVVSYSDTQWSSKPRQYINCLISRFYLKRAFTHLWVAGIYQYEYARKLGFRKDKIIYNSLSCNSAFFDNHVASSISRDSKKRLLFVGRLVQVKGVDLLIEAWKNIRFKSDWELIIIGSGLLKELIINVPNIQIIDHMDNNSIIDQMKQANCFVLPSRFEPWGVVIHEAAAAGLPIIASNVCGAVPHFLINNYNGFVIESSVSSIQQAIERLINLDNQELLNFSINSKKLANSITPDICVSTLISIL